MYTHVIIFTGVQKRRIMIFLAVLTLCSAVLGAPTWQNGNQWAGQMQQWQQTPNSWKPNRPPQQPNMPPQQPNMPQQQPNMPPQQPKPQPQQPSKSWQPQQKPWQQQNQPQPQPQPQPQQPSKSWQPQQNPWQQQNQPQPQPQNPWQQTMQPQQPPQQPSKPQNPWQQQNPWQPLNNQGQQPKPEDNRVDEMVSDTWPTNPEVCQDGQFRPVDSDANQFEMCVNGRWVVKNCAPGTLYDTTTMSCAGKNDDGKDNGDKSPVPTPKPRQPTQNKWQQQIWQQPASAQWQQMPAPGPQPISWQQSNPAPAPVPAPKPVPWQPQQPTPVPQPAPAPVPQPAPWQQMQAPWQQKPTPVPAPQPAPTPAPQSSPWQQKPAPQPAPWQQQKPAPWSQWQKPSPAQWQMPTPAPNPWTPKPMTPEPTPSPATPEPATPAPATPEPTPMMPTPAPQPVDPWVDGLPRKCKSGTRRPVVTNDDAFEVCDNGEWVFMLCAPGTWFDNEVKDCTDGFAPAPAWPVPKDMMPMMKNMKDNEDMKMKMMNMMMNMMPDNTNDNQMMMMPDNTDDNQMMNTNNKMQNIYTNHYGNADMMQQKMPAPEDMQMMTDDMMMMTDGEQMDMQMVDEVPHDVDPNLWLNDIREVIIVSVEKCKVGRTREDDSSDRYQECIMNPAGTTMWIRRKCAPGTQFSPWTRNCGKVNTRFNGTDPWMGDDEQGMMPEQPEEMQMEEMTTEMMPEPTPEMMNGDKDDDMTGGNGDMMMPQMPQQNPWANKISYNPALWNNAVPNNNNNMNQKDKKQLTITFKLDNGY